MYQRKCPVRVLSHPGTSRGKENDAPISISDARRQATTPSKPLSLHKKFDRVLSKLNSLESMGCMLNSKVDGLGCMLNSKVDGLSSSMETIGENVGLLVEMQCRSALEDAELADPANGEYYSHFQSREARLSLELKSIADLGKYLQLDEKEVMAAFTHVVNTINARSLRVILEGFLKKAQCDIANMKDSKSKEKCLINMETFHALLKNCKDTLLVWSLAAPARKALKVYGQSSSYIKFIFPVIEEAMEVLKEFHTCSESLSVHIHSVFPFAFLVYQARNDLASRLEIDLAGDCIRTGADFMITVGEIKATRNTKSLQAARFQVESLRKMILIMLNGIQEETGSTYRLKQFRSLIIFGRHGRNFCNEQFEKTTNIDEHANLVVELLVYLRPLVY